MQHNIRPAVVSEFRTTNAGWRTEVFSKTLTGVQIEHGLNVGNAAFRGGHRFRRDENEVEKSVREVGNQFQMDFLAERSETASEHDRVVEHRIEMTGLPLINVQSLLYKFHDCRVVLVIFQR